MSMSNVHGSKVLVIRTKSGDRYFSHFGKRGSVQTAWSLAGACHFLLSADLIAVTEKLEAKKKRFAVYEVVCSTRPAPSSLLRGGWDPLESFLDESDDDISQAESEHDSHVQRQADYVVQRRSESLHYECPKTHFNDGVPF